MYVKLLNSKICKRMFFPTSNPLLHLGEMSTFYTSQALAPEVVTYNHSFGCSSPGCVAKVSPGIDMHRLYRFFPLSIAFSKHLKFYTKRRLYWIRITRCMRFLGLFLLRKLWDSQKNHWMSRFRSDLASEHVNKLHHNAFNVWLPRPSLQRRFSVASALRIFRDIPRDPSRTCALDVDIYVTDFTNNAEHANPEVVDSWQKSQLQVEIFTYRPSWKSQHF